MADVPVGVLLSGGLDSSLLVALLAEAGVSDLRTFSVGFEDTPEEAGFHGVYKGESDHDEDPHGHLKDVFLQIVTNKYVWIMAAAYSCTGAVRQTIDQCSRATCRMCTRSTSIRASSSSWDS